MGIRQRKRWTEIKSNDTSSLESSSNSSINSNSNSKSKSKELKGTRFGCKDLFLSDSEEELDQEPRNEDSSLFPLAERMSSERALLFALENEHKLRVQEKVRTVVNEMEANLRYEMESMISEANHRIEKFIEERRESDRKIDRQHQRRVAEILDRNLSAIQRDHEQRSQIVERKIRDDAAAIEEAKRRERERLERERLGREEKARQERAKQEAEAAKLAEEARKSAREAELKKEAAELEASRMREKAKSETKKENVQANADQAKQSQLSGVRVIASERALEAEAKRLMLYNQVPESVRLSKEFGKLDRQIAKSIKQLTSTVDSVRSKAQELTKAIGDPGCPRPVSFCIFANKVVSLSRDKNTKDYFACAYVILLITSRFPEVMDYILAELHRVCIYTVPKYIHTTDPATRTNDFYKMIGYREEEGKLETRDSYLSSISSYIKLYAAIIQTEIEGYKNPHGLEEGWKWIARFLNRLPPNSSTAFALESFLKMAGFALHRTYKSQFMKILDIISRFFLPALKEQGERIKAEPIQYLEHYLQNKIYLQEPEGRQLVTGSLLSHEFVVY